MRGQRAGVDTASSALATMERRRYAMIVRLIACTAVVFLLSGLFVGGAQPVAVGLIPAPWDKLAHVAVFAALTWALLLAAGAQLQCRRGGRRLCLVAGRVALWGVVALALAAGAADELHQAWSLPGRHAGWDDWLADAVGVALTATWALWSQHRAEKQVPLHPGAVCRGAKRAGRR